MAERACPTRAMPALARAAVAPSTSATRPAARSRSWKIAVADLARLPTAAPRAPLLCRRMAVTTVRRRRRPSDSLLERHERFRRPTWTAAASIALAALRATPVERAGLRDLVLRPSMLLPICQLARVASGDLHGRRQNGAETGPDCGGRRAASTQAARVQSDADCTSSVYRGTCRTENALPARVRRALAVKCCTRGCTCARDGTCN